MVYKIKNFSSLSIIMFFPIFFILMPRPDIAGIQFLTYPLIAVVIGILSVFMLIKYNLHKSISTIVFLLISLSFIIALSIVVNNSEVAAVSHMTKIFLFIIVFIFGNLIGFAKDVNLIIKGLLKAAYIILTIQIVVSLTQLLGAHSFSWLYSMAKTRPFGGAMRVAGTLANPNFFSWIVIQMGVIIFLFEINKFKKIIWTFVVIVLIFLSGSRTFLLIFPVMILFVYALASKKNIKFYLLKLPSFLLLLFIAGIAGYRFLLNNALSFPYLSQILSIFETGSLESVNSFYLRTLMWKEALYKIEIEGGWITWMFGLGPGSIEVLDNDYLYSIVNYGVIFLAVNLLIYFVFTLYFIKTKDRRIMTLGIQYIVFSLLVGIQSDTLSGWNYPLLIMFYAGIIIAINIQKKKNNVLE